MDPDNNEAYFVRGMAYAGEAEFAPAIQDFSRAIALDPDNSLAYYNRGLSRLFLEEWEKAELDLSHAQSLGFDIRVCILVTNSGALRNLNRITMFSCLKILRMMLTPKQ